MAKRTLAFLGIVASALILGGCVFGGGGDDPEATATAEVTATPDASPTSDGPSAPTGTATPEVTAELPPGLEASAAGTWESRELRDGDDVPNVLGAFVFDVRADVGTLWSLAPNAVEDPGFVLVSTSPDANYVVAEGDPNHLVSTETGASWSWGFRSRLWLIDDRGLALFSGTGRDDCMFWVADLAATSPRALSSFRVGDEPLCGGVSAMFSPDGATLLFAIDADGGVEIMTVDLASGELSLVGVGPRSSVRLTLHGDQSVTLALGAPGSVWLGTYDWEDRRLSVRELELRQSDARGGDRPTEPSGVTVSPDGRWVAWSEPAALGFGSGAGGRDEFPVTVITSSDGQGPLVRAQRVARTNGTVSFGWVADSSALVVQSEDGFALLSTDGGWWELPFQAASHFDPVPIPAPHRTDRFVYGGLVIDVPGNANVDAPAVADEWARLAPTNDAHWWVRTHYGWGDKGRRLVFVRTEVLGSDYGRGGIASLGLGPRLTAGPPPQPREPIVLQVTSDGDRLNARAAPGVEFERLGQFADGTLVTVGHDRSFQRCGSDGCSILADPDREYDEGWWIYVTGAGTEGDLTGWVSSEFLDWAD